jgi:serine/threonine-protein kinase
MEYGGDRTLRSEIKAAGRFPVGRALHIAAQVCDALAEAHGKGIVHRDLKPANILLGARGDDHDWVKVVDLGIAKLVGGEPSGAEDSLTGHQMIGSPAYASPEQAQARPLDGRSDLYSLGVVLYEMLTGDKPIHGKTAADVWRAQVQDAPTPPRAHGVRLPVEVERILLSALEKEPEARIQSAAEMGRAIRAALAAPPPRRRSPVVPALTTLLILLAGGGAWWAISRHRPDTAPPAATAAAPVFKPGRLLLRTPGTRLRSVTAGQTPPEFVIDGPAGTLAVADVNGRWQATLHWKRLDATTVEVAIETQPATRGPGPLRIGAKPVPVELKTDAGLEFEIVFRFTE